MPARAAQATPSPPPRSSEAILFDLGNTLVRYYEADGFEPILRACVAEIVGALARRGHALDEARAFEAAKALNSERDDHRVQLLAERLADLLRLAKSALVPVEMPAEMLAELTAAFLGPIFALGRVDADAVRVLRELRRAGKRLAIVSNTPWGSPAAAWRGELARLKLLEHVDAAVFCTDVGWRKPARPIFAAAVARLGVAPGRAVFVGDDKRWDVAGATQAGLAPVLLAPAGDPGADCTVVRGLGELIPLLVG